MRLLLVDWMICRIDINDTEYCLSELLSGARIVIERLVYRAGTWATVEMTSRCSCASTADSIIVIGQRRPRSGDVDLLFGTRTAITCVREVQGCATPYGRAGTSRHLSAEKKNNASIQYPMLSLILTSIKYGESCPFLLSIAQSLRLNDNLGALVTAALFSFSQIIMTKYLNQQHLETIW